MHVFYLSHAINRFIKLLVTDKVCVTSLQKAKNRLSTQCSKKNNYIIGEYDGCYRICNSFGRNITTDLNWNNARQCLYTKLPAHVLSSPLCGGLASDQTDYLTIFVSYISHASPSYIYLATV